MTHIAKNTAPRRVKIRVPALLLCILTALSGCGQGHGDVPDVPALPDVSVRAGAIDTIQNTVSGGDVSDDEPAAEEPAAAFVPIETPAVQASGRQQPGADYAGPDTDPAQDPDSFAASDVPGNTMLLGDISGLPDDMCSGGIDGLGLDVWSGEAYVETNGGRPYFDIPSDPYETVIFSALDDYKRPGSAYACIVGTNGRSTQDFGWKDVPVGWQGAAYPDLIPGGSLYHKIRLVSSEFYAVKKDSRNMIAVTQYCNENGITPVMAALSEHINKFGGYMAVRVTPIYTGASLLCDGILIEAASIGGNVDDTDDDPDNNSLSLCMFCYNVQPGVEINYKDGSSSASGDGGWTGTDGYGNHDYILDEIEMTFHEGPCAAVAGMRDSQRREYRGPRNDLIENRYEPCGLCMP